MKLSTIEQTEKFAKDLEKGFRAAVGKIEKESKKKGYSFVYIDRETGKYIKSPTTARKVNKKRG